jgi:hypothetical protein
MPQKHTVSQPDLSLFASLKEVAMFEFIKRFIGEHGRSPSYDEIANYRGLGSRGHVLTYIKRLEKFGLLYRVSYGTHRIRLGTPSPDDLQNKHPADGFKMCSACGEPVPLDEFPTDTRRKDGRGSKCDKCIQRISHEHYAQYPEDEALRRLKQRKHQKKWDIKNKDSQIKRQRIRLLATYGLTEEAYDELLSSQDFTCAICQTKSPSGGNKKYFHVDHDHVTGYVRGLLCHRCNCALGLLMEDVDLLVRAVDYMRRSSAALGVRKMMEEAH